MSVGKESVTVRVPGSTSNCGAGFDCLGLALTLYNRITVTRLPGDVSACSRPEPERDSDGRGAELVQAAAAAYFAATGRETVGFRYRIEGDIPPARGLGSSATVIVGVLAGLDALHGTGLSRRRLAEIGTLLEGNPENVVGAVWGGFAVNRTDPETGAYVDSVRVTVPEDWRFVVVSPAIEMATKASRGVLPATLAHRDAVRSINSAAYVAAIFATGEFGKLRSAIADFVHEPYRLPRIPGAAAAITAGCRAGALAGWLSGSGSSVLCVAEPASAEGVASAMRSAFSAAGVGSEARVLAAENDGYRVA